MNKKNLEKYADLAVKIGVGVKKGQTVIINSPINAFDLAREITKKCYEVGAKDVIVEYNDEEITHQKLLNSPDEVVKNFPKWRIDGLMNYIKEGAAVINIVSSNPDLLSDVKPERLALQNKVAAEASKEYKEYVLGGKACWTIVAYPNQYWANKVFPGLSAEEAIEKLWSSIFKATRVDNEDPIKAWEAHINNLNEKLSFLNEKSFEKLIFTAPGTNLEVQLPKGHVWIGGGQTSVDGDYFLPNIPTEEVFTVPKKTGVNGTLRSTKPLNYKSNLIDNFELTFKDGKIIDFKAENGYDTLKNLIETDKGSHFLGEVALVPHDSPISNTDIIFYNTLYDENASCHFAIGSAYLLCIEDGPKLSKEDKENLGINDSLIHVDFMVGCPEMNIQGITKSGEKVQIFKDGNWAF
ncbi:aminopeptidase [Paramaledivibacter caminithermalis]|uniref:Aminopeptidase n=1 Tax=Paramaledivibacter caminithermalis (strain DSM 15212 / CIP 107654 / DViRD3) TaxID=1121301 RepID=A0A1M6MQM6_PARC5|nr:aminopeptidase [Paramaledivibacter caminithermalis]SHJ85808.1 aminopeptidase [Paramaledivibacter caminithermalis DSM 15212]